MANDGIPQDDPETRALAEMDSYIQRDVAGGFLNDEEIVDGVVYLLRDDYRGLELTALARRRTALFASEQARAEAAWPKVTDCERLDQAFADLEARGIVCRQDFSCCGTCGAGEIRDEMESMESEGNLVRGYAFYHQQDTEAAVEGRGIHLDYGSTDESELAALRIGHEICDVLRTQGLPVDWDGTWAKRIAVKIAWKRRRPPSCRRSP